MSAEEYADMSRPELVEELERKDEQIQDLAKTVEFIQDDLEELRDLVTGELAITLARNEDVTHEDGLVGELQNVHARIDKVERGEIDPGQVVAEAGGPSTEDLLPIHQMYLTAKNVDPSEHGLSKNQELAALVFPHFDGEAFSNEGKMSLPTNTVRKIIERKIATPELAKRMDVEDPNPTTLRRVMKFFDKFGGDMFSFDDTQKQNRITADRDDWLEYANDVVGTGAQGGTTTDDAAPNSTAAEDTPQTDEIGETFEQLDAARTSQ